MKLMRSKFVAIVVTLAMVLSMLAVPVVSADTTKPATSADAAAFLSSKNLLQGDNGNLMLDQTLTREQMMVILSRLLGQEDTAKNYDVSKMTFTDVPQTDGYAPYVAWAQDKGFAQGYSSTQFGFGQSLTAQQTKAFFLRALGETVDDSNWNDVDTMAADYGISDNSTVASSAPITRGDMALLMSNTVYATNIDGDVLGEKLGVLTPVVTPPTPSGTQPVLTNVVASATTTSADTVTVTGSVTPATATTVTVGGTAATVGADGSFTATYTLDKTAANGLNNIAVVATNGTLTATQNVAVTYVPNVAAAVTAAVASDSPVSNVVVSSGANVPFLKVALTATGADAKVTSLQLTRSGLSDDSDVPAIRIYDGTTQKGGYGLLNNAVSTIDLSYDPILLTAGQTKEITVKADTGATPGKYVVLGVTNITAVKSSDSSAATVTASYPLNSATMQISAVVASTLKVSFASGSGGTIVRGAVDQAVGNLAFNNTSASEKVYLNSVTLTRQGSSLDSDIQNIKLFDGATLLGQATSISNGKATIQLTNPLEIKTTTTKSLTLTVTLAPGTTSSSNATFAVYASTDVSATGATSGDSIVIFGGTGGTSSFPVTSNAITFDKGTLTTTSMAGVTDVTPVKGQNDVTFLKLNFSASATEGINIRKLRLQRSSSDGSGVDNDLTNLKIFDANGNQVGPTLSGFLSGYATFDLTGNPIQIPAGNNVTYAIKAGISANAVNGHKNRLGIDPTSTDNIDAIGAASNVAIDSVSPSHLLGSAITGVDQTIQSVGSLTVSAGTTDTIPPVRGAKAFEVLKINLTSGGEDVKVNSITVTRPTTGGGDTYASTDVSNLTLFDGSTQVGTAISTLNGATATFNNLNYVVPINTTKTLSLKLDIPSSATISDKVKFDVLAAGDISATGNASTTDLVAGATLNGTAAGTKYTIQQGSITISPATLPTATTYAVGATDSEFARFYFSAQASNEDISVSSIQVGTTGTLTATDLQDIKLFNGTTQLGATQQLDGTGSATFNLTTPLVVTKGTIVTISVKATPKTGLNTAHSGSFKVVANGVSTTGLTSNTSNTIPASAVAFGSFGINTTSSAAVAAGAGIVVTPVSMTGIVVGSVLTVDTGANTEIVTVTATAPTTFTATFVNAHSAGCVIMGSATNIMNISTAGSLAIGIPGAVTQIAAQNLVQGNTAYPITTLGFTATNANVNITSIKITGNAATTSDLCNFSLWDGSTQVGTTIPQLDGSNTATFVLTSNPIVVTQGTDNYKLITVKADVVNATNAPNALGNTVTIGIASNADVLAQTVGSAITVTPSGLIAGKVHTIAASSVTAVKAALPTTSPKLGAGIDLGRWTITNNGPKSVTINQVELTDTMATLNGTNTDSTFVLYNTDSGLLLTAPMAWATGSSTTNFTYGGTASLGDDTGGAAGATGIGITLASGKSITIGLRLASNAGAKPLVVNSSVAVRLVGQNASTTTSVVSGTSLAGTAVPIDNNATSDSVGLTS